MHAADYKIILCDLINPQSPQECLLARDMAIVLRKKDLSKSPQDVLYFIEKIVPETQLISHLRPFNQGEIEITDARGLLALPAFYDMHFHWVQDDVRVMPKDSLLTWLTQYTWPYEKRFASKSYTQKKAKTFANELLACGTLGGGCYGSIHGHTVDIALSEFIGDFVVGNVLMTMNSPSFLSQTTTQALQLIKQKSKKYGPRYALTPRFAPTTHPEVMQAGSVEARAHDCFIQSHLCETKEEIDYVLSLYSKIKGFEKVKSYTEIYKRCGILGPKTIMGHGIHLDQAELKLLSQSKTVLAHCPTSNAPVKDLGLGSGLFDWQKISKAKIPWVLASDIGGGPYLSMFDVMESFVAQNHKRKIPASYTQALYHATKASAKVLKLDHLQGSLEANQLANFILVPSPAAQKGEDGESVLKKIISPYKNKREKYAQLVHSTYYHGHLVYLREGEE